MPQVEPCGQVHDALMQDGLVEHLATVGANALAEARVASTWSAGRVGLWDALVASTAPETTDECLPPLRGDEPHVEFLSGLLGEVSSAPGAAVASLDSYRLRRFS